MVLETFYYFHFVQDNDHYLLIDTVIFINLCLDSMTLQLFSILS
jgi:hypothetical protein